MYLQTNSVNLPGPGTSLIQRANGLGCGDCGGSCGCSGMGMFDSGLDWSGWGWQEWATVGFGTYVLFSVFSTTQRAGRKAAYAAGAPVRGAKRIGRGLKSARQKLGRKVGGTK